MAESSTHSRATVSDHGELTLPPNLKQKLEEFQNRLWSIKIAEGALAGLAGLGLSYLVVFVLDRLFDTPEWMRYLIVVAGFAIPAITLPLRWHRWITRQQSLEQIARLLKRRFPRLGDELLGIVELSNSTSGSNSPRLIEAAMAQMDQRIADRELDDAVPENHYRTWFIAAGAAACLSTALLVFTSSAAQNALSRWVSPWKPVDRYTYAQLEVLPDEIIVPYAENFQLNPTLSESTVWEPASASVKLPGKTKLSADRNEDQTYPFDVPPQKQEGVLGVRVGDEYHKVEVTPMLRPELVELEAEIRLPDYLRYSNDPVLPIRGGSVSVVEGATASFRGTTSRALDSASMDGAPAAIAGDTFSSPFLAVETPTTQLFTWTDIHGLQAKAPLELKVSPVEDTAPDVFARQLNEQRVILENEVVTFDISASDDFGLKRMGLQWWGSIDPVMNPNPAQGEKSVSAGAPEKKEIKATATFSALREGIRPQTIQLRAFAEDFLPNRERSYSPTFIFQILSPEDHANWLTQEFGKWFRSAREVYEREQQLHEGNRALRQLSADALDRPENRRRLREQASNEAQNARQLDALTASGRELVKEAAKNDEFDAERLESWASMMRSLDDIAGNRMPSVSDLLQQASQAKGNPKQSDGSSPQEPSVPSPGISDPESSLSKNEEDKETPDQNGNGESSGLGLPSTTLGAAKNSPEEEAATESPAQEKLGEAFEEQVALLAEFSKIADQLQEILSSLEASTFVKRLKAASRKQFEIAEALNETLDGGFGLPKHRIEQKLRAIEDQAAIEQREQSHTIYNIQSDLEAYFQRKQTLVYKNVLDQMRDQSVVSEIKSVGDKMEVNLTGRSIAATEFWGDTLDRWAEELVAASDAQAASQEGKTREGLPPEIVLKIMKLLQEEMYLRDETRELEATRPGLAPDVYTSKVKPLELTQQDLRERTDEVIDAIEELPDGSKKFPKEIQLLTMVSDVMRQARAVLSRPDTGFEAIAAETEVIELLLQSKRQNQSRGGGSGSSPGGGGSADRNDSALSDISLEKAGESGSGKISREVEQSTGQAGRKLPEEYRRGLDLYFNALESN